MELTPQKSSATRTAVMLGVLVRLAIPLPCERAAPITLRSGRAGCTANTIRHEDYKTPLHLLTQSRMMLCPSVCRAVLSAHSCTPQQRVAVYLKEKQEHQTFQSKSKTDYLAHIKAILRFGFHKPRKR